MSVSASQFAGEAMRLLSLPEIPYRYAGTTLAGMDCQGSLKYCAQQLGVKLNYSGSNDMYRNACSWVGTISEAKAQGRIVPGAVGFIVEYDGQEGEQYKRDGLGNASHVGIITLSGKTYSVDASSSAGKVRGQAERDAVRTWTHIGWLKVFDYGTASVVDKIDGSIGNSAPAAISDSTIRTAVVITADGGSLNMRRAPSDTVDNRVGHAPFGVTVEVLETRSDGWAKIKYEGVSAWVRSKYLTMNTPTQTGSAVSVVTPPQAAARTARTAEHDVLISLSDSAARELHSVLDAALFG